MHFVRRLLISFSAIAIAFSLTVKAQNHSMLEEECANRLVESCNAVNYSNYGSGSSVFSTTELTPSGRQVQIFCQSDANGISCYQNHSQWFTCSPDHTATYKGTVLSMNSSNGVDDEICYAAERLSSGNVFSSSNANVQAMLEKTQKRFNKQMADLHDRLDRMNQRLQNTVGRKCFPFCGRASFGPGFPFNH